MLTKTQIRNRTKWVKALRSGKYRQGQGWLVTSDRRYCCLGVAKVAVLNGNAEKLRRDREILLGRRDAMRLGVSYGHLTTATLTRLNDRSRWTFNEIADLIELDTMMEQDGAFE